MIKNNFFNSISHNWNPAVNGTKFGVYSEGVRYPDWNGNGVWDAGTNGEHILLEHTGGTPGYWEMEHEVKLPKNQKKILFNQKMVIE